MHRYNLYQVYFTGEYMQKTVIKVKALFATTSSFHYLSDYILIPQSMAKILAFESDSMRLQREEKK